jgi:dolichol-phosphate mannosyltransferase
MSPDPVNFAIVIPLANEAEDLQALIRAVTEVLNRLSSGQVYLVVDRASKDNTLGLCQRLSDQDPRFITIYEPLNRHVVDAYLRGYRAACEQGHEFIVEMDAGLSHDPAALPLFLEAYRKGYDCVFGSRFMKGGSMSDSGLKRKTLSLTGTWLSNVLLGTRLRDMTSGYQGFKHDVVKAILDHGLRSTGHFYQTEVRYLLRYKKQLEVPIHYKAPSPRVSAGSIRNSVHLLFYYFYKRIRRQAAVIP